MLSLPNPNDPMMSAIIWLYLITNAIRIFTYVPQIVVVWRCTDGAFSVSLLTWGSWVLSHVSALFYGVLVVHDVPFVLIAVINLFGCASVTVIVMHRRAQWRRKLSRAVGADQNVSTEAKCADGQRTRTIHWRKAGQSSLDTAAQVDISINT